MNREKTAYVRITTWTERLSYASHFYCHISFADYHKPDVEIRRNLSAEDAKALNKTEKRKGRLDFQYKPGDNSGAYLSRVSAMDEAIRYFKKWLVPTGYTSLVDGEPSTIQPQPVVSTIKKFVPHKSKINKLCKRAETNDWWEGSEKVMKQICAEWEPIMEEMNK